MTDLAWLILDSLLVLALLALAWMTCTSTDIRRGITLFTAFGLLLALVWARLRAPDLALAEAVIGAGITGALLLSAIGDYAPSRAAAKRSPIVTWAITLMTLALFLVISWSLWQNYGQSSASLLRQALTHLPETGVSNPVTAVLLNFRAYDTLLELAVVLSAALCIVSLNPMRAAYPPAGVLLTGMTYWLVPLLIVTSGYLLWVGAHAPGGAFQAGALLAAALIVLQLTNLPGRRVISSMLFRVLLVIGIAVFVAVGLLLMMLNHSFLNYPETWAGLLILLIEAAATLSIAAALSLAYLGGRPAGWEAQHQPAHPPSAEEQKT